MTPLLLNSFIYIPSNPTTRSNGYLHAHAARYTKVPGPNINNGPVIQLSTVPSYLFQWHAAVFVGGELLKSKYPTKAPTATASMTHPLYVMNSSLLIISPSHLLFQ